jgi:hypothetical protein
MPSLLDGEAPHQLGLLLLEVVVGHATVVEALVERADGLEQPGRRRFAVGGGDGLDVTQLGSALGTFGGLGRLALARVTLGRRLFLLCPLSIPLAEAGPPPAQRTS